MKGNIHITDLDQVKNQHGEKASVGYSLNMISVDRRDESTFAVQFVVAQHNCNSSNNNDKERRKGKRCV